MQKYCTLILIILSSFNLLAQDSESPMQVIILENGSIIKGKVYDDDQSKIQVKLYDGEIIFISKESIKKIQPLKNHQFVDNKTTIRNSGYFNSIKFGFLNGLNGRNGYNFQIVSGYIINSKNVVGIGIEASYRRFFFNNEILVFPITGHFKRYFSNRKISPYMSCDLGWGIPKPKYRNRDYFYFSSNSRTSNINYLKTGLFGRISSGLRISSWRNRSLFGEVSFDSQRIKYALTTTSNGYVDSYEDALFLNGVSINFGMVF